MEGSIYPISDDCSKYYSCSSSYISIHKCPPGYLFDQALKKCNFASRVSCSSTDTSHKLPEYFSTSTRTTTSTTASFPFSTRYTVYFTPLTTKYNIFMGN
jgi:hypothetical protein